jgi:hypothetical protein
MSGGNVGVGAGTGADVGGYVGLGTGEIVGGGFVGGVVGKGVVGKVGVGAGGCIDMQNSILNSKDMEPKSFLKGWARMLSLVLSKPSRPRWRSPVWVSSLWKSVKGFKSSIDRRGETRFRRVICPSQHCPKKVTATTTKIRVRADVDLMMVSVCLAEQGYINKISGEKLYKIRHVSFVRQVQSILLLQLLYSTEDATIARCFRDEVAAY